MLKAIKAMLGLATLLATPAIAQNSFPTAGGATVTGYVTMCVTAGVAVPCNPSTAPLLQPSTLYSAAGTPLPACNAGTNGASAVVSDSTAPTYRNAYASGGAITARVLCVSGTGWVND